MENILQFLSEMENNKKLNIGVVGDAILDEYYEVSVKRISPEYPIPILLAEQDSPETRPGGAANVAYQFKHFNVDVSLHSFCDSFALNYFDSMDLNATHNSVCIPSKIPRKKRYFQENAQLSRIDFERSNCGLLEHELRTYFENLNNKMSVKKFDAIIYSDYNKGLFNKFDNSFLRKDTITIVDSKNGDLKRWKGCTVFKPNEKEALALSGKKTVDEAGNYLSEFLGSSVVVTQAANGVSVFENGNMHRIKPTKSPAVAESVIGAGDAFIAFLAMALCKGFSLVDSAEIAFKAGTLYVLNKKNKPLTKNDILYSIDPYLIKKLSSQQLLEIKKKGEKLVFTNGCFDMFHTGHLASLKFAKSCGDKLVVGLNSDKSVSRLKPGRPIISEKDRLELLASCEYVDYVVLFDEDTPLELIKNIGPDVVVKGADYKEEDVVGYGIVPEIKRCPLVEGISTTQIIEKIKSL